MFLQTDVQRGIVAGGIGRLRGGRGRGVRSLRNGLPTVEPRAEWDVPAVPQCWPSDIDCNERARLAASAAYGRQAYLQRYAEYEGAFANWRRNYLDNPAAGLTLADRPAAPVASEYQNWTDAQVNYYQTVDPNRVRIDGGPIRYGETSGTNTMILPAPAPYFYFENLRRGSVPQFFRIGDQWRVTIRNAQPNTDIVVTGGRNGEWIAHTVGRTDFLGQAELSATMTAAEVGTWAQRWSVGQTELGILHFTVEPAAVPTVTSPSGGGATVTTPPASSSGGAVVTTPSGSGAVVTTPSGGAVVTTPATTSPTLAVSALPSWAIPAGIGAAVLLLVMGGRR